MVKKFLILILILFFSFSLSFASEIFSTASSKAGNINAEIYNVWINKNINLKDLNSHKFKGELIQELAVLKGLIPITYKINFYTKLGFINSKIKQNYSEYIGKSEFSLYGGGLKYIIFPDTIITPAVIFDFGVVYSSNLLDRLKINGLAEKIDTKLDILEYQGTIIVSKKLNLVESFFGIKFFTNKIGWQNKENHTEMKGINNYGLGSFLGASISFYPLVSLVLEVDFINETAYSAGLNFEF